MHNMFCMHFNAFPYQTMTKPAIFQGLFLDFGEGHLHSFGFGKLQGYCENPCKVWLPQGTIGKRNKYQKRVT